MAIKVSTKVWKYYPNGGTELLLLLALADYADDEGYCYPSIATIAKKIRLSDCQARRKIHTLIKSGYVKVVGNEFGGRPGSSREYRINLNKLTPSVIANPRDSIDASGTPSMNARDGSHMCAERANADASLTVIESLKKPSPPEEFKIMLKKIKGFKK